MEGLPEVAGPASDQPELSTLWYSDCQALPPGKTVHVSEVRSESRLLSRGGASSL